MASHRPSVPQATKRALRRQAGDKCANPGCPAKRVHLHHVREWAVYQSHDGRYMVAVCPNCHDSIHHGSLELSDDRLLAWKSLQRDAGVHRGHLYVEPGEQAKLLLGSIAVTGDSGLVVFELSDSNWLSFALKDEEIVLLSLQLADRFGRPLARLVDGYISVEPDLGLEYRQIPGTHQITAPVRPRYVPRWATERIRRTEPDFATGDEVSLLRLEVLEPGLVRVEGIWLDSRQGVVITESSLHFVRVDPLHQGSIAMIGDGSESVLHWAGPITTALFGFGEGHGGLNVAPERTAPFYRPSTGDDPLPR